MHRAHFEACYRAVLERLYPDRNAGFAILLIAFPLLEQYLRQKVGAQPGKKLPAAFHDELTKLFPTLGAARTAKEFWQIYRHGLLHEDTMSGETCDGTTMQVGQVDRDETAITLEPDGTFWVNPVGFAQCVVRAIESDFATFATLAGATDHRRGRTRAPEEQLAALRRLDAIGDRVRREMLHQSKHVIPETRRTEKGSPAGQAETMSEPCVRCNGCGWVCEAHSFSAWDGHCELGDCGSGLGVPCICNPESEKVPVRR